jgi:hypothetical protein
MARRKIVFTAEDDGHTVRLVVEEWEGIGSSQVGPELLMDQSMMSFPVSAVEDWRRDMAVLFVERL